MCFGLYGKKRRRSRSCDRCAEVSRIWPRDSNIDALLTHSHNKHVRMHETILSAVA